MSHIPDCRKGEGLYNENYLNNTDKEFIKGYDKAFEDILNMFNNMDIYTDEFLESDFNVHKVNDGLVARQYDVCVYKESEPEGLREEREADFNKANPQTQTILKMMECLTDWYEGERNERITAMIDNMSEQELEANKEKCAIIQQGLDKLNL